MVASWLFHFVFFIKILYSFFYSISTFLLDRSGSILPDPGEASSKSDYSSYPKAGKENKATLF